MTAKAFNIVGLGNPGAEYDGTRHNIGRDIVMHLQEHNTILDEHDIVLLVPDTYMNLSGGPVSKLMQQRSDAELIVIHDDIDLPLGTVRISRKRGSGGQKGVENIIKALGHNDFIRIRVGIAPVYFGTVRRPRGSEAVSRFVLKRFGITERATVREITKRVTNALEHIVTRGVTSAMNEYNK